MASALTRPTHPIVLPLPPDAPVDPGYGIPINAPYPDQGLPGAQPHPEHPIVLPPDSGGWLPVFIWGQPHPDHGLPTARIQTTTATDSRCLRAAQLTLVVKSEGAAIIWTPADGWQTIVVLKPQGPHPTPSKKR